MDTETKFWYLTADGYYVCETAPWLGVADRV